MLGEIEPWLFKKILNGKDVEGSLAKTYKDPDFQKLIKKHKLRLFGGPMLSSVTDKSVVVWLRTPQPADLKLTVKASEFAIESGGELEVPVTLTKLDGFADEFELTAIDLPYGVTVEPQTLPAKSPASAKLKFRAAEGLPFPASPIRIVARFKQNDKPVERFAQAAVTLVAGS